MCLQTRLQFLPSDYTPMLAKDFQICLVNLRACEEAPLQAHPLYLDVLVPIALRRLYHGPSRDASEEREAPP